MLDTASYYSTLPIDLSGSRSKNRFRIELLWGVCKMLDLLALGKDFAMVFDYACDIEVHYSDGFEFYQIKTHGKTVSSYTSGQLVKKATANAEGSILGKLYRLNISGSDSVKLFIVSNVPLSANKKKIGEEVVCLGNLPQNTTIEIDDALKKELNVPDVDLSNVFYLCTDINLRNPENEVQGKLVMSFEQLKGCEPSNPHALYRLIVDTVTERACYEFPETDYDTMIAKKGITKDDFDHMLDCHAVNEKTGIKQTNDYIDRLTDIRLKRLYKKALANLLRIIPTSRLLRNMELRIAEALKDDDQYSDIDSAIDYLTERFHDQFPIEYDNANKTVFYIIVISKFEEGVYDDEDDI